MPTLLARHKTTQKHGMLHQSIQICTSRFVTIQHNKKNHRRQEFHMINEISSRKNMVHVPVLFYSWNSVASIYRKINCEIL